MSNDSDQMDVCDEPLKSPYKKIKCEPEENVRTADGGYKVKTYYPTLDDMKDFSKFMKRIHDDGGHKAGLAKIVPPHGYKPRKVGYEDESLYEMEITHPIKQEVNGEGGLYQQLNVMQKKKMSVRNFKRMAEEKHPTPIHTDGNLERTFWKNIFMNPSLYGADVPGSLFDPDCEHFNLTRLDTIIDDIKHDYGVTIEGVNTTYLYFGMWKSSFCWHTEDVDLYSINYLHAGAPKAWYCIAPEYGKRFERLAASLFPHLFKNCRAFLRHKTSLISPAILKKYSIPFSRATQQAGEFMVTFPYSYHSGYNHGFNIAEATNFALEYWIEFGKWATKCECSSESVKISMQTFVKKYQADRYADWVRGRDIGPDPRDPKHKGPAPKPSDQDLFVMGIHERSEADIYEEDQKVALQQNLSCNLKKSKSSKKSKKIKTDYHCYDEYLKSHDSIYQQGSDTLPHFSLPTMMSDDVGAKHIPLEIPPFTVETNHKPDYDAALKKLSKKIKSKKVEISNKVSEKKEKRAKERIQLSQELLHYLPTSFTQEKKFNRCIAAQSPHCSVCQLFVLHPKDDDTIWGTKTNQDIKQSAPALEQPVPNQDSQATSISQSGQQIPQPSVLPPVTGSQNEEFKLPESSNILLPRITFAMTDIPTRDSDSIAGEDEPASQVTYVKEGDSGYGDFLEVDLDKPSELIQCTVCMLAVHKICYGMDKPLENKNDWICDRCVESNRANIGCTLCPCRGGALKKFNDTWVHISCALTLNQVSHADLMFKKDLKFPEIPARMSCLHCVENMKLPKYVQGHTIKCNGYQGIIDSYECSNVFHPTCGHRNGALFDAPDFHINRLSEHYIKAQCSECVTKTMLVQAEDYPVSPQGESTNLDPISVGTQVIVETKKGNLVNGIVEDHRPFMVYDIFYPELSTVEVGVAERNLILTDRNKELRPGDEIRVKAQKGDRRGKVKEKYLNEVEYVIKPLRSSHTERINRNNIYLNIDQLSESQLELYLGEPRSKPSDNISS